MRLISCLAAALANVRVYSALCFMSLPPVHHFPRMGASCMLALFRNLTDKFSIVQNMNATGVSSKVLGLLLLSTTQSSEVKYRSISIKVGFHEICSRATCKNLSSPTSCVGFLIPKAVASRTHSKQPQLSQETCWGQQMHPSPQHDA